MGDERQYDVTLGVSVAIIGTMCAAVGLRYMKLKQQKYTFLFMALGAFLNMVALQFAPQSAVMPLDGLQVFWTVLMDDALSKRSWRLWFYVACIVAGCALVVVGSTHTVAKDVDNPYIGIVAFVGTTFGVGAAVLEPETGLAVIPGIQGGFTQALIKAVDLALRTQRYVPCVAYVIVLSAMALSQFLLLDRALKTLSEVQVNPLYTLSLTSLGTLLALTVFGEFHTDKILGYVGGFVMAGIGTYRLSVYVETSN